MTRTIPNTRARTTMPAEPTVLAHFNASAALYRSWSPAGHLHFGYWKWPIGPKDRAGMLEAMVHRVVGELGPRPGHRLADLGCGYGTPARLVAGTHRVTVDAFSVVQEQVDEGRARALRHGSKVRMHCRDFRDTGLAPASMDGVYAIESLCYGAGHGKQDVLAEAARILRPGGRIALVDGFIISPPTGFRRRVVRSVERGWALPCFPRHGAFLRSMERAGFTDIRVIDLSWRVAPSALHGLPMLAWTMIRSHLTGKRLDALEKAHLRSCLLGILLGTQRDLFRYQLIAATRNH